MVTLAGAWTRRHSPFAPLVSETERGCGHHGAQRLRFEVDQFQWDGVGAVGVKRLVDTARSEGLAISLDQLPDGLRRLLELAAAVPTAEVIDNDDTDLPPVLGPLGLFGLERLRRSAAVLRFLGAVAIAWLQVAKGRARFQLRDLLLAVEDAGPRALGIVTLISVLVGVILAFIGSIQLEKFGAQIYVSNLVGLAMVREMGAIMAGVLLAGRTGAAFAAEIGTMQVNEEVDALKTFGINPIEFLVVPRMAALFFMMPPLCIYANVMGIVGGGLVSWLMLDISWTQYLVQMENAVALHDVVVGVLKSGIFGLLVGFAGCLRGMECGRSADAVGRATTSAVVTSIILIVITDAVAAVVCSILRV